MRRPTRDKDEGSGLCIKDCLAAGNRIASFQDVEDLVNVVVDMSRWSSPRPVRSLDEREPSVRLTFANLHLDAVPVGEVERASSPSSERIGRLREGTLHSLRLRQAKRNTFAGPVHARPSATALVPGSVESAILPVATVATLGDRSGFGAVRRLIKNPCREEVSANWRELARTAAMTRQAGGHWVEPSTAHRDPFRRVTFAWLGGCCEGMSAQVRRLGGLTVLVTTQRCLPILRSRTKPSSSYVERAPLNRKPAGTESASSG